MNETFDVTTSKVVTILLMIPGLILVIQPPFIFPEVRNINPSSSSSQ